MEINLKNILICIGIIVVTYMGFNVALKVLQINYTLNLIKEDSAIPLTDYDVYADLSNVLKKYFRCLRNNEYEKLKDMSLYYAKMSSAEYKQISDTIVISELFEIVFNDISVLEEEIYLCNLCIKNTDSVSQNIKVVVKLNRQQGFFRVLNLEIDEV